MEQENAMNKKTVIEREYQNGELIREKEIIEEWETQRYVVPTPFPEIPQTPTWNIRRWWQQPWTVTDRTGWKDAW